MKFPETSFPYDEARCKMVKGETYETFLGRELVGRTGRDAEGRHLGAGFENQQPRAMRRQAT